MGHATLAMTMRDTHLSQRHEAGAVAKLDVKLAENRNTSENEETELIEIPGKQASGGVSVTIKAQGRKQTDHEKVKPLRRAGARQNGRCQRQGGKPKNRCCPWSN